VLLFESRTSVDDGIVIVIGGREDNKEDKEPALADSHCDRGSTDFQTLVSRVTIASLSALPLMAHGDDIVVLIVHFRGVGRCKGKDMGIARRGVKTALCG